MNSIPLNSVTTDYNILQCRNHKYKSPNRWKGSRLKVPEAEWVVCEQIRQPSITQEGGETASASLFKARSQRSASLVMWSPWQALLSTNDVTLLLFLPFFFCYPSTCCIRDFLENTGFSCRRCVKTQSTLLIAIFFQKVFFGHEVSLWLQLTFSLFQSFCSFSYFVLYIFQTT